MKGIAAIAKQHNVLTIVDNTFLTPYLQQALTLGADIVIHSATKYLSGHSDVIAGLVVTNTKELGDRVAFVQNAIGGVLSPEDSSIVRRRIQTLAVRMDRTQENAKKIIEVLTGSDKVFKIHYPGLAGDASDQVFKDELRGGSGVVSVTFKDDIDLVAATKKLKYFKLASSLGSVESLLEIPFSMSHTEIPEDERNASGITEHLVRISVGIEDGRDLVADLKQAFEL